MLRKYYKNDTFSIHRPTQKVATCQILSAKTKSKWQISLSKFNNHFRKVRVKWINFCMDLQDSVQRSLQNPAEKILQISTDSQRSKVGKPGITD